MSGQAAELKCVRHNTINLELIRTMQKAEQFELTPADFLNLAALHYERWVTEGTTANLGETS